MPRVEVQRTYVQMLRPDQLVRAPAAGGDLRLNRVVECPTAFYRWLYAEVGREYHWLDRSAWTDAEIRQHLSRAEITIWVLYSAGAPAGYFELQRHDDDAVEIAYFGLLPEFKGRGLGKHLLTAAVERAWAAGARRVWLHTCSLDDPAALPNYRARGFRPYREETYRVPRPAWTGASIPETP
jgi:ribosomal protein S18 acetylase RimI-like enzyme